MSHKVILYTRKSHSNRVKTYRLLAVLYNHHILITSCFQQEEAITIFGQRLHRHNSNRWPLCLRHPLPVVRCPAFSGFQRPSHQNLIHFSTVEASHSLILPSLSERNDRLSGSAVSQRTPSLQSSLQRIGCKMPKQQELDGASPKTTQFVISMKFRIWHRHIMLCTKNL